MTLEVLNQSSPNKIKEELFRCCGCTRWAERLSGKFPFTSIGALKNESDKIWFNCNEADWHEAFSHHPRIGDIESLEKKFSSTKEWAEKEQASVSEATKEIIVALKKGNEQYEKKFGYVFIIFATGKSAIEMLDAMQLRLHNVPEDEIKVAMKEQNKITHLRLDKLFS